MIKLIVKLFMVVIIILGIANYLFYVKTGQGGVNLDDISMPELSFDTDKIKKSLPTFDLSGEDDNVLYKWVDENGNTQYSQQRPEGNISTTIISPDETLTVIPAAKTNSKTSNEPNNETPAPQAPNSGLNTQPESVQQLIDQAKDVQNVIDERDRRQRQTIDSY